MGKKKFINKKSSATFRLVYRDYSTFPVDGSDRVFTRVDGGSAFVPGFDDDDDDAPCCRDADDSIFADAPEDAEEEAEDTPDVAAISALAQSHLKPQHGGGLPGHVRRELIELGFPDDGYNYLQHLREIGPSGSFFPNSRARPDLIRADVKAYDATRLDIHSTQKAEACGSDDLFVSSGVPQIRGRASSQRMVDSEVTSLLEATDGSEFDSADEIEDDFITKANEQIQVENSGALVPALQDAGNAVLHSSHSRREDHMENFVEDDGESMAGNSGARERPNRLLDEQFELLTMREYNDDEIEEDSEDDLATNGQALVSEFNTVLSDFLIKSSLSNNKYQTPAEFEGRHNRDKAMSYLDRQEKCKMKVEAVSDPIVGRTDSLLFPDKPFLDLAADNLLHTDETEEEKEVIFLEDDSNDDERKWDCETVVSTFSNVDNHPAKIDAPTPDGRKKMVARVHEQANANASIIRLRGKNQLPVDFLPGRRNQERSGKPEVAISKPDGEKDHANIIAESDGLRAGEMKEERKARKAAVKEERRDARRAKKELKQFYRGESRRAQHGAAFTGPSVIPLK